MSESIFTTPRRGFLGQRPVGAEYMDGVERRAKRMRKAMRPQTEQDRDDRQMFLPVDRCIGEQGGGE